MVLNSTLFIKLFSSQILKGFFLHPYGGYETENWMFLIEGLHVVSFEVHQTRDLYKIHHDLFDVYSIEYGVIEIYIADYPAVGGFRDHVVNKLYLC